MQAPFLLSLESQRQLGFQIDIANNVVYSTTLQSKLKLVQRDGLLATRLIPSYIGLTCTINDDGQLSYDFLDDEPGSQQDPQQLHPEHGTEANKDHQDDDVWNDEDGPEFHT